jgi:hypothetical protein
MARKVKSSNKRVLHDVEAERRRNSFLFDWSFWDLLLIVPQLVYSLFRFLISLAR